MGREGIEKEGTAHNRPQWLPQHSWEALNEALGFPSGPMGLGEWREIQKRVLLKTPNPDTYS